MSAAAAERMDAADGMLRRGPGIVVLTLGLPLALGLASHALINLVDLVLVGRLGEDAIRAAHVASTWNFLPMILGNCVANALLGRLSRRLGEGDPAAARALHRRAQWFMLWFSCGVAVVSALPASAMVAATGVQGPAGGDAVHYLVVSNLGCVPMFLLMQTTAAMRAAGEAMVPLLLLLLANLLNLGLDYLLLFGWDAVGVPGFGVVGAAYATVLARGVGVVLAFVWLRRRRHVLSLAADGGAAEPVARVLLLDAWPQVVQIGLRAGLVVALTVVVQRGFGDAPTASLGITTRLDTVILFAALGFANAATAYAGRAVAAGRPRAARAAGCWAAALAGVFGLVVLVGMQCIAPLLVRVFLPDAGPDVVEAAVLYLHTVGWGQVLGAVALGAIGAVQGAGRMVAPLVVDALGFGVLFALMAAGVAADAGLVAAYHGILAGMLGLAVLHLAFVRFGRWPWPRQGMSI
ncbi:MAG: MATE family efflux transporter [Planctomycetes bacterium]|nr:MATE family efflux transporter [Planctomycetota bacterium]